MSRFNIILNMFFCFLLYSYAVAMNQNYYLSDDIKKIILFKAYAKCEGDYGVLPQEIKDIIALKSYCVYYNSLPLYDEKKVKDFEFVVNNKKRLNEFYGQEIHLDHPAVLMMNDKGRTLFLNLKNHIEQYKNSDGFVHPFSGRIEISKKELSEYPEEYYVTRKDCNKILKLPLQLRSCIGKFVYDCCF